MNQKEARSRVVINKMLEDAGWRFFDNEFGKANIQLEPNIKITTDDIDEMGEDYENAKGGFVDYLLLDEMGDPFLVLEAKSTSKHPLTAKEQARKYANSLRAKYIILSNGIIHYFWNLEKGNPEMISSFPSYDSLKESRALNTDISRLVNTSVDRFYIAVSQEPSLLQTHYFKTKDQDGLAKYCYSKNIRVLRDYQIDAIKSIQQAVQDGKNRFLFEMATGTGKTLTAAGLIKLFIRSETVNRVLFLVDRLELENQAMKDLRRYLSKDGISVCIYKDNKESWRSFDVVISTIQSFTTDSKYKYVFSPADFDLVISDEAHRSLGTNNRAILEYFIGYKLGLTATPKNYLKNVDFDSTDPRELERRMLLDTYQIFGCSGGNPTYSYTLNDGVRDGILVNPVVVDARTDITTQLLSDEGLLLKIDDDNVAIEIHTKNEKNTKIFTEKSYEKKFFSDSTNEVLCQTFLENAQRDPISNEIGKSIIFCVNIEHARKITEILNVMADKMFPGVYFSDFAVQITSNIPMAQDMTMSYSNNNLNGKTRFLDGYDSSKSRVAVTVGMMTTGYDCPDILNLGLFRPIFSPSEFIQIKGRGTRLKTFTYNGNSIEKTNFKLFDFFAVCEYFENEFKYDEILKLPKRRESDTSISNEDEKDAVISQVINKGTDYLRKVESIEILNEGMKIDRKFFQSFENKINSDVKIQEFIKNNQESALEYYLLNEIFDKPNEFYNIKKLERSLGLDRSLTIKEIVSKIFGRIDEFKTRAELVDDEFENFVLLNKEQLGFYADKIANIKSIFQAYLIDSDIRSAIREKQFQSIITSPIYVDFKAVRDVEIRGQKIINYIAEYVLINDINCDKLS